MSEPDLKSFASRKFDIINAIVCDPRLRPSTTRVATALLSFANAKTWAIYPSQERVALMVDLQPRMVRSAIAQLVATGWLHKERTNRRTTNQYFFEEKNIGPIRDRLDRISDEFGAMRGTKMPLKAGYDRQDTADHDRQDIAADTGNILPPNTPSEPPEVTTHSPGQDKESTEFSVRHCGVTEVVGEGLAQLATQQAEQASPSSTGSSVVDSFRPIGAVYQPPTAIFDRIEAKAKWRGGHG